MFVSKSNLLKEKKILEKKLSECYIKLKSLESSETIKIVNSKTKDTKIKKIKTNKDTEIKTNKDTEIKTNKDTEIKTNKDTEIKTNKDTEIKKIKTKKDTELPMPLYYNKITYKNELKEKSKKYTNMLIIKLKNRLILQIKNIIFKKEIEEENEIPELEYSN
jgi:hypothetical protein